MRKTIVFICAILQCVLLTACDPGSYQFDSAELINQVTRIELIEYDNPDQKHFLSWVPDQSDQLLPFDDSKMTVLGELDTEKIPDFSNQLAQSDILHEYYTYDSPNGTCLKLSYSNGDFLIISCYHGEQLYTGYICRYASDGAVAEFIGSFATYDSFESLMNDFFETELPSD